MEQRGPYFIGQVVQILLVVSKKYLDAIVVHAEQNALVVAP